MLNNKGIDICIVCINVAFGNAAALQNTLNCNIAVEKQESKGYAKCLTKTPYSLNNIPSAEHYIFVGSGVVTRVDTSKLHGRKTIIITDSHYLRQTSDIDKIIERDRMEVFCMSDLWQFCKFDKKMYIHPFLKMDIPIQKSDTLTICHSPYSEHKKALKGTNNIAKAISLVKTKYKFNTEFIIGKTWSECLKIKSCSHIFIDQLCIKSHLDNTKYTGGLGKSGLEGMLLKSLTLSSGHPFESDIPKHPYIPVNSILDAADTLSEFIENEKLRNEITAQQNKWASTYTDPQTIANRIINN